MFKNKITDNKNIGETPGDNDNYRSEPKPKNFDDLDRHAAPEPLPEQEGRRLARNLLLSSVAKEAGGVIAIGALLATPALSDKVEMSYKQLSAMAMGLVLLIDIWSTNFYAEEMVDNMLDKTQGVYKNIKQQIQNRAHAKVK